MCGVSVRSVWICGMCACVEIWDMNMFVGDVSGIYGACVCVVHCVAHVYVCKCVAYCYCLCMCVADGGRQKQQE